MKLVLFNKLQGHKGSVYSLWYDSATECIWSGGGEGWVVAWPPGGENGQLIVDVGDQIFSLLRMSAESQIVIGTMSGDLFFVNDHASAPARKKVFHQRGIFDLMESSDKLISAGGDGKLGIWNPVTTEIEESIALSHRHLRTLAVNPSKDLLAVGASDGHIYILSLSDWRVIERIESAHQPSVFTLAWLDDSTLASGGRDAHLRVWKLQDLTRPAIDIAAHWYTINHLVPHPVEPILASASRDKTIRLWDLENFSLVQSLDASKSGGHVHSVNRLAWSPDGKYLYAGSDDRSISVWQ